MRLDFDSAFARAVTVKKIRIENSGLQKRPTLLSLSLSLSLSRSSCVAFARNAVVFPSAQVSSTLTTNNGGEKPSMKHPSERTRLVTVH